MLTLSEHYVREEYISQLITVIATTPQLHSQVIAKVYFAMRDNTSQMGIAQLGAWLVGEFGEILVNGQAEDEAGQSLRVDADAIVDSYIDILDENDKKGKRSDTVISWALTALSKLAVKLPQVKEKINELVDGYTDHGNVEI